MRIIALLLVLLAPLTATAKDRFLTVSGGQTVRVTSADNVETFANSSGAVAIGDAVYLSAAGTVAKASATTTGQPAMGLVYELVDATHCVVITSGVFSAFSSGMTAGTAYYLAETSGALQTTPVLGSGKLAQYIGVAVSATDLAVAPQNMSLSGTSGGRLIAATYDGKLPAMDGSNLTNLPPGGDGIAGATGSTDNAVLRADGTGGGTAQASPLICDDVGNLSGISNITLSGTVDGVDVSAIPSLYQPADATLTGVSLWAWSSGTEVKTLTAADTFGTLRVGTSASNLVQLDSNAQISSSISIALPTNWDIDYVAARDGRANGAGWTETNGTHSLVDDGSLDYHQIVGQSSAASYISKSFSITTSTTAWEVQIEWYPASADNQCSFTIYDGTKRVWVSATTSGLKDGSGTGNATTDLAPTGNWNSTTVRRLDDLVEIWNGPRRVNWYLYSSLTATATSGTILIGDQVADSTAATNKIRSIKARTGGYVATPALWFQNTARGR